MFIRRVALALGFFALASSASAKDVYLSVAGTVNNFHTDARIFNPSGTKDIQIVASFLPAGNASNAAAGNVTLTIPKRQQAVFDDVVTAIFHTTGLGAIRLSSNDDFVATSRIFAQTATGTLGQFVPGLDSTTAMKKGVLVQLKSSATFRTNIGAVNPNAVPATVTWKLYDKNNVLVSTGTPIVMPPFAVISPTNIASTFFFTPGSADLSDAWVAFSSDQPVFAYASIIDNATTDPTFIPASVDSGSDAVVTPPAEKVFTVTLRNFEIVIAPDPATIQQNDKVRFKIVNEGGTHGFTLVDSDGNPLVPGLVVPQNQTPIERTFTAAKLGTYTYACTQPSCGSGHSEMFGSFDVGKAANDTERPGY